MRTSECCNEENNQDEKRGSSFPLQRLLAVSQSYDQRPVTMLSSRHNAVKSFVKNNYLRQAITKPVVIQDYNQFMGGVNNSDSLLTAYLALKLLKWYHKLLLHLINMVILNLYILNKKYGVKKMRHSDYREFIAKYLLTTSLETATCTKKKITSSNNKRLWMFHLQMKNVTIIFPFTYNLGVQLKCD